MIEYSTFYQKGIKSKIIDSCAEMSPIDDCVTGGVEHHQSSIRFPFSDPITETFPEKVFFSFDRDNEIEMAFTLPKNNSDNNVDTPNTYNSSLLDYLITSFEEFVASNNKLQDSEKVESIVKQFVDKLSMIDSFLDPAKYIRIDKTNLKNFNKLYPDNKIGIRFEEKFVNTFSKEEDFCSLASDRLFDIRDRYMVEAWAELLAELNKDLTNLELFKFFQLLKNKIEYRLLPSSFIIHASDGLFLMKCMLLKQIFLNRYSCINRVDDSETFSYSFAESLNNIAHNIVFKNCFELCPTCNFDKTLRFIKAIESTIKIASIK